MKNKTKNYVCAASIIVALCAYLCFRQTTINEQIMTDDYNDKFQKGIQPEDDPEAYLLDSYLINPTKKTVRVYEGYIVGFGDGAHGHGYHYVVDSTINYDNTTLFIIGNQIFFKEHVDPKITYFEIFGKTFSVEISEAFPKLQLLGKLP